MKGWMANNALGNVSVNCVMSVIDHEDMVGAGIGNVGSIHVRGNDGGQDGSGGGEARDISGRNISVGGKAELKITVVKANIMMAVLGVKMKII